MVKQTKFLLNRWFFPLKGDQEAKRLTVLVCFFVREADGLRTGSLGEVTGEKDYVHMAKSYDFQKDLGARYAVTPGLSCFSGNVFVCL